jgi:hypothetical protein
MTDRAKRFPFALAGTSRPYLSEEFMDVSLIIFASGIVFGGACAILAANKNRDPLGWFALGFFFSLIALIVVAALSPAEKASADNRSKRRQGNGDLASKPKDPERPWLG